MRVIQVKSRKYQASHQASTKKAKKRNQKKKRNQTKKRSNWMIEQQVIEVNIISCQMVKRYNQMKL
eukprot:886839-Ditylum_brightwellii.AAC.1